VQSIVTKTFGATKQSMQQEGQLATVRWRAGCELVSSTQGVAELPAVIRHPDIRVKHYAYGHGVATLLNTRGVATVSPQVQSNSRKTCKCGSGCSFYRALSRQLLNKTMLIQIKFKSVNQLFALIIYYKLLKVPSYETQFHYNSPFCKRKHLHRG
jgi:hypothetical protein